MGAHIQVVRVKKLTGSSIITHAARHNLREIQTELGAACHIDPARTKYNEVLCGETTSAGIAMQEKNLLEQVTRTLRKDAVRGLELVISLPPDSGIDERGFFDSAITWAGGFFEVPILSAVIHNDEAAPHLHIVMLPLFDGRMIGAKLMGDKRRLEAIQADFHDKVGQRHGLARGCAKKRYSLAVRTRAKELALTALRRNRELLDAPVVRDALGDLILANPADLIAALGMEMPEPKPTKSKTFASIMTKQFKNL